MDIRSGLAKGLTSTLDAGEVIKGDTVVEGLSKFNSNYLASSGFRELDDPAVAAGLVTIIIGGPFLLFGIYNAGRSVLKMGNFLYKKITSE
jgi:hypothetical protein